MAYNSLRINEIFSGTKDSFYEIVALNSAFALSLSEVENISENTISEKYKLAKDLLDSGSALKKLNELVEFTKSY